MTLANDGSPESGWGNDPWKGNVWRYGTERACSLEGQYVTFVADFSSEAASSYEKALCTLGVFGQYLEEVIVNIEQETSTLEQDTSALEQQEQEGIKFENEPETVSVIVG